MKRPSSLALTALALGSLLLGGCVATRPHVGGAPYEYQQAADADTANRVRAALAADYRINARALTVTVVNGQCELGGSADNIQARDLALRTASRVPGVRGVRNNIVMN